MLANVGKLGLLYCGRRLLPQNECDLRTSVALAGNHAQVGRTRANCTSQIVFQLVRIFCRYELQYAVAGQGGGNDTAVWQTLGGNGKDTWVITVQVDGFDRSF